MTKRNVERCDQQWEIDRRTHRQLLDNTVLAAAEDWQSKASDLGTNLLSKCSRSTYGTKICWLSYSLNILMFRGGIYHLFVTVY